MTTINVRRFEEQDWYGLAGCTRFADGSEPFIGEMKLAEAMDGEALVVGDAEAVQVHVIKIGPEGGEDWQGEYWHLSHSLPPFAVEAIVRCVAEEITNEEQLKAAGFERI